jgi:hypothetical protein
MTGGSQIGRGGRTLGNEPFFPKVHDVPAS